MTTATQNFLTSGTFTASAYLLNAEVTCQCYGALGANSSDGSLGGKGALMQAVVPLAASGALAILVGTNGSGATAGTGYSSGGVGHTAGTGGSVSGGGGGSSSVTKSGTLLLVAGGGGGSGSSPGAGGGGGYPGQNGSGVIGSGGNGGNGSTGGAGGAGATGGGNGASGSNSPTGTGGAGGTSSGIGTGGGGGGGYAGGGGGGGNGASVGAPAGGGGGGGASYYDSAVVTSPSYSTGVSTIAGEVAVTQTYADAPNAPTLLLPPNDVYLNANTTTLTFTWTYNPGTDSGTQNAFAMRRKYGSAAYGYWNGTDFSSSTPVWNTSSAQSVTIPSGILGAPDTISWSIATQESNYDLQSPFAADNIINSVTFIEGLVQVQDSAANLVELADSL